jgi:hypothetical protein
MGSSMAQLDVQFGAFFQLEVPPMEAYLAAPGITARVLQSASALAIPPRKDPLMTKLHCLRLSLVALDGGCSASNAGNVLIADQWNNRVIEIDRGENIVWSFGDAAARRSPARSSVPTTPNASTRSIP